MKKTILITGASSGIGRVTALFFARAGWQVSAAMRTPEKETELTQIENVFIPRLDVNSDEQVSEAIRLTTERFGTIDVLVNNAGYGLVAPFERASEDQIERQFATNVFGLMRVTRAVIPWMRKQNQGLIINVASIGGRMTFPFYSLYHATKWCVEGFSESMRYELMPAGIQVKVIEPGPILTDFYTRSADAALKEDDRDYGELAAKAMKRMSIFVRFFGSSPDAVAKVIYRAATDGRGKFRYPAGWAAHGILISRKLLPDIIFSWFVKKITLG